MNSSPDYINYKNAKIADKLDDIILDLRTILNNTMELNVMEINIDGAPCALVTIEGMVSTMSMSELIFRPLMEFKVPASENQDGPKVLSYADDWTSFRDKAPWLRSACLHEECRRLRRPPNGPDTNCPENHTFPSE